MSASIWADSRTSSSVARRRLFWPALTTLLLVSLATALGAWQLQRREWKLGVLAQLDRAEAAAPATLPADPLPFEKVEVTGTLEPQFAAHYRTDVRMIPTGQTMGASLLMPLARADGPAVLVDLGWLPDQAQFTPPAGPVRVVGYVRPQEARSWVLPGDDLTHRRFWSLDPSRIGAALGAGPLAPFTVVALEPVAPGLQPAEGLPRPPNDHLSYAITWFSLGLAGLVIFILYARGSARP